MLGAGISLVVAVVVLGGIGAAVYFAVRGAGGGDNLTFRSLLRAYLRVAFLVSLGVFVAGAIMTLTAAFGGIFGHDFSYRAGYGGGRSLRQTASKPRVMLMILAPARTSPGACPCWWPGW